MEEKPIKIKRNINQSLYLKRVKTGKELANYADGAWYFDYDYDDPNDEEELDLISGFIQTIEDVIDIYSDLEASDKIKMAFTLNSSLEELKRKHFVLFANKEIATMEGGVLPPENCPILIARILRDTNKEIHSI